MESSRKYVHQVIYNIYFWLVELWVFLCLFSFILVFSAMKNVLFLFLMSLLHDCWNTHMR